MPKAKITKSFVDSVPFKTGNQIAYCDTELRGFYLIVGSEAKTYVAQKGIQGRTVRCTIGRHGHFTTEQARKVAKEKLYQMSSGIDPTAKKQEDYSETITLGVALEKYLTQRRSLKPRTVEDYRYYINKYLPDWRDKKLVEITKEAVGKYSLIYHEVLLK